MKFGCLSTLAVCSVVMLLSRGVAADVALDSLDLAPVSTGWGRVQAGKSAAGLPLAIVGKSYQSGFGVHAPSLAQIRLDGKAERFRALVGVNDGGRNEPGSVEFTITGDGKKLFSSGVMRGGDPAKSVDIPLRGIRNLQLSVSDAGDNNHSDHADWADVVISYSGVTPAFVAPSEVLATGYEPADLYPSAGALKDSPGNTTWYVDPKRGNDAKSGRSGDKAWKSISKVNAMRLRAGDKVIVAPGLHDASLKPTAEGTAEKPVVIRFLPGVHEFPGDHALGRPWFISNSCDAPKEPKFVGILVEHSKHLKLQGGGAEGKDRTLLLMGGRMVHLINQQSQDITYQGLAFDLKRPTVSEFRVMDVEPNAAVIQIAEGSAYRIDNGKFSWTGDWGKGRLLCQQAQPEEGRCWRGGGDPFATAKATDLGNGRVRLEYADGNGGLVKGRQHHFRLSTRDTVGVHNSRSKDIAFLDCDFHALTNMGIVSQFTENITFRNVKIAPPAGTIRTCPGWADALHFSGCKGQILIDSCFVSGLQDDPVNVHGTHLRIVGKPGENQLQVRFMHPQTYGFEAFMPGDEVAVVSHSNLRELPGNPRRKVLAIAPSGGDGKDWILTLDGPAPAFGVNDVIDNVTWYPDVTIRNTRVTMIPTRGFLLTTRGKVLVENNTFHRCAMPGILIEDDANGWFESGPVRSMVIRNNKFIGCGIEISPKTSSDSPQEPVHENIVIDGNFFDGAGISARNTRGLVISNNRSKGGSVPLHLHPSCGEVKQENNAAKANE